MQIQYFMIGSVFNALQKILNVWLSETVNVQLYSFHRHTAEMSREGVGGGGFSLGLGLH